MNKSIRKCMREGCSYTEPRGSRLGMFFQGRFYCDPCYAEVTERIIRNGGGLAMEDGQERAPGPLAKRPIEGCEFFDDVCECEACSIKRGDPLSVCKCTPEGYPHPNCEIHCLDNQ